MLRRPSPRPSTHKRRKGEAQFDLSCHFLSLFLSHTQAIIITIRETKTHRQKNKKPTSAPSQGTAQHSLRGDCCATHPRVHVCVASVLSLQSDLLVLPTPLQAMGEGQPDRTKTTTDSTSRCAFRKGIRFFAHGRGKLHPACFTALLRAGTPEKQPKTHS